MKSRMMGNKPLLPYALIGVLVIWSLVSIAALGGMYKLWWERERVNYLGKTIDVQRSAVLRTAGLPESLLDVYKTIDKTWPRDITYTATGDHNQLSYLKYLLIPRIPSGSAEYSVDAGGTFIPVTATVLPVEPKKQEASIFALLGSLFILGGITLALKRWLKQIPFSFPELFGCTLLVCMGCVVLSRVVFAVAVPAFYLLAFIGVVSWAWLFLGQHSRKRTKDLPVLSAGFTRKDYPQSGLTKIWQLFLVLIIVFSILWAWLMSVIVVPDDWDAWAIWAAKAKVLALGHGRLIDVSHFGHADYPLLWPSVWAFAGWFGGGWEEMWSRGWGGIFLLFSVWEIAVIVERLTGRRNLGLLAGALFVSMPMVPLIASWSYAEAPFWLLLIACCGCLALREREDHRMVTVVAALLATAAAYTKNEGVMFAGFVGLWILFLPGRNRFQAMMVFLGIFTLCYAPWMIWTKYVMQFGSHATSGLHFDIESIRRAAHRLPAAVEAITRMWGDIKQWNIVLWLGCGFALFGVRKGSWRVWLFPLLTMLLGYFIIIVFHEAEIYWQVGTSWNRLTVHILPFLLICMVCQGEEILYPDKGGSYVLPFKSGR
ncbi:MAG: hypothetical protein KJ630_19960 [Proteobacteria bacterium]|nr:hypothetical protein [Pseudomonadota bacterium]